VAVPWSAIRDNESRFISRQYVPTDVKIKDPSKLQSSDADALLEYWYERQKDEVGETFVFKAWMDKDNAFRRPAGDRDSSSEYESEEPDEPFDKRRSADEELEGGEEEEDAAYEVEVEIEHAAAMPMPRHGKSARADMATPDDSVEDRRPKRTSRLEQSASDEDEDEDGDGDGEGDDVPTKRTRSTAAPSGEMQRHQRPQRPERQRPKRYM
jgi:hypothetical protein